VSMTTVFVDASDPRKPREICRDSRDPTGDAQKGIEHLADAYSRCGRTVRVYAIGQYVPPWRKNPTVLYESRDGRATPDFRTVSA
jgi:hypothetical protein